jgi:hypothetical protein
MIPFRVVGIPEELAQQARTEMRSPQYGHPAHAEVAKGYGPCRSCLDRFQTGEDERLLFTYNPFAGLDPYPSPGPISNACSAIRRSSTSTSATPRPGSSSRGWSGESNGREDYWGAANVKPWDGKRRSNVKRGSTFISRA